MIPITINVLKHVKIQYYHSLFKKINVLVNVIININYMMINAI